MLVPFKLASKLTFSKTLPFFTQQVLRIVVCDKTYKSMSTMKILSDSAENTKKVVVAVTQMCSTSDKDENLRVCSNFIAQAASQGAQMIYLPEACDYIAESPQQSLSLSEPLEGALIKKYCELANLHRIWVSVGGFHQRTSNGTKMFNAHVLISSEGQILSAHHKTHLFDVEIPEQKLRLKESDYIEKGSALTPPVATPFGKIGLGICYDIRFPEFASSLANRGAEILTYPSAFTVHTGKAHWETLLRARAIETQCFVVAAAQTGQHNAKRASYGHAMVVDPWGEILAELPENPGIALANLDMDKLKRIRKEMPIVAHKRTDLYGTCQRNASAAVSYHQLPSDDEVSSFGQVRVKGRSIFLKTASTIAFTNKKCVVVGHVLVTPIRVVPLLEDLTPAEVSDLFLTVQKVEKALAKYYGVTSSTVAVQNGPEAGQTIKHIHVHVLPRRHGDFEANDDVYRHLAHHDKESDLGAWRDEEEMAKEAALYRPLFYENQ